MPSANLPDLRTCLEAASWRRLLAIMASHGRPCSTRWHKADLIAALYAQLTDEVVLERTVLALGDPARTALDTLLQAEGALPAATFTETFGAIRPHRPWRDDNPARTPWQNPASPAERLWYLGLLHFDPPAPGPGIVQRALVPADLLAPLGRLLLRPEDGRPLFLYARPGQPSDLAWHVALLLATAAGQPIPLRRERWLTPRSLAALAQRTGLDQARDFTPSRSERSLPYLAFVHALARAAGLVAGGRRLAVTPAGWAWLAASPAERWQTLWQAWLTAAADDFAPLERPWAGLTPQARALIVAQVKQAPLDRFVPLANLVSQAHLHDERDRLHQTWYPPDWPGTPPLDVIADTLCGPLFWFGIVDVGGDQPSPLPPAAHKRRQADADARESPEAAEPWLAASRGADDQTADTWEWSESAEARPERPLPSPDIFLPAATEPRLQTSTQIGLKHERPGIPPFVPDSLVRLTLAGGWLLGLPDCGAPAFAVAPPCRADHVTPDLLLVPPSAAPLHLARLAPLCRWLPPQFPALDQRLQLDPERVGQAVAQGTSLPQILHDLAEALAQPIGRRQADRLRAWARAGQQVRVRQLTVLETADAELMGRLRSRKLVRRHLGEAISPTRAALNPAGLPALAETLRHLGLYVALPPAASDQPDLPAMCLPATYLALSEVPDTSTPRPQIRLEPAEAGMLWLAGLVYVGLGEHLALPAPLSPVVFDTLAGQLSAAQQQAARHLAQQALEAVAATLRGYLGLPAWQMPGDQADVLPLIEQALAARQDLLLTYFGAGREQPVVRRVTPYWLERRGGVPYLIAYCHLREAERVFRVDRITECRPVTG